MNAHGGQLTSHGWRAAPHALVLAPVTHPAPSRVGAHVAPDDGFYLAIWLFCTDQSSVSQLQFIEHIPWQPSHSFTFEVIVIL